MSNSSTFKCFKCKTEMSTSMTTCPTCGNVVNPNVGFFTATLTIVGVILTIIMLTLCSQSTDKIEKSTKITSDPIEAYTMGQSFVRERLKSPDSAKFPSGLDKHKTTELSTNKWEISSYVDSQNSFGAMIRTRYKIVIEKIGPDTWKIHQFQINE